MEIRILVLDDRLSSVRDPLFQALRPFFRDNETIPPLVGGEPHRIFLHGLLDETIELFITCNAGTTVQTVKSEIEADSLGKVFDLILLDDQWGMASNEMFAGQETLLEPVFRNIQGRGTDGPVICLWTQHWEDSTRTDKYTQLLRSQPYWGCNRVRGLPKSDAAGLRILIQSVVAERRSNEKRFQAEEVARTERALRVVCGVPSIDKCPRALLGSGLVGSSPAMRAIYWAIERFASSDLTVLIQGESGTGKEFIAQSIRNLSQRRGESFVTLNCSAIPKELLESEIFGHKKGAFTGAINNKTGLFKLADRGTVFLDEIGEMDLSHQAKVLRLLEAKKFTPVGDTTEEEVDVRIIAATNRDLTGEIAKGTFRSDLYYRLAGNRSIYVPPLRERAEDIPEITDFLIDRHSRKLSIPTPKVEAVAYKVLQQYSWPGNGRELDNFIEQLLVFEKPSQVTADMVEKYLPKIGYSSNNDLAPTLKATERSRSNRRYEDSYDGERARLDTIESLWQEGKSVEVIGRALFQGKNRRNSFASYWGNARTIETFEATDPKDAVTRWPYILEDLITNRKAKLKVYPAYVRNYKP